jgi:hypothetical protein
MPNRTIRPANGSSESRSSGSRESDLESIRTAVEGLRFGEVRVIVQDGVVVQIERVEKQRLR